jgi:hypothetical protein
MFFFLKCCSFLNVGSFLKQCGFNVRSNFVEEKFPIPSCLQKLLRSFLQGVNGKPHWKLNKQESFSSLSLPFDLSIFFLRCLLGSHKRFLGCLGNHRLPSAWGGAVTQGPPGFPTTSSLRRNFDVGVCWCGQLQLTFSWAVFPYLENDLFHVANWQLPRVPFPP